MVKLKINRYSLRSGKFGLYFYDSKVEVDLTLEMVLNKLNLNDKRINEAIDKNNIITKEIFKIKGKMTLLKYHLESLDN